ncbi:MAG: RNA 2',3'-cyclic phosphodiesterase [Methylocystaceae bacterium]
MKRLFIALDVRDDLRHLINKGIEKARSYQADIKWVEEHNLHLTIKFLGDQPEAEIPKIISELEKVTPGQIKLSLTGVGYFPNQNRPRTIWLGIGGEIARANGLAAATDNKLEFLHLTPEKKRQWHLTLGRVRSERNFNLLQPQLEPAFKNLHGQEWHLDSFTLYQSTLTPGGPIYQPLHKFQLTDQ